MQNRKKKECLSRGLQLGLAKRGGNMYMGGLTSYLLGPKFIIFSLVFCLFIYAKTITTLIKNATGRI